MMPIRIGSRGSALALWQSEHIAQQLRGKGHEVEIEVIRTTGDKLQGLAFNKVGTKGMFTKEIEDALRDGAIELAVHSLKDLPTELAEGFALAAIPPRPTRGMRLCRRSMKPLRHCREARAWERAACGASRSCGHIAAIWSTSSFGGMSIRGSESWLKGRLRAVPWLAVTSLSVLVVRAAAAGDLPMALLTAARAIPADTPGHEVCLGFHTALGFAPTKAGDDGKSATRPFTADVRGAYLGGRAIGDPIPPFVQALLSAGAAERLRTTWVRHVQVPTMAVPRMRDLGTTSQPPPPPLEEDRVVTGSTEQYVVMGPDAAFFRHDDDLLSPVPPAATDAEGLSPAGGPAPPGVWRTGRVCYSLVADRVLEYGDPVSGNGVSQVSALLAFRPERMPRWASDPMVAESLSSPIRPIEFRLLSFRDDGDGWRATPFVFVALPARTHIVGTGE